METRSSSTAVLVLSFLLLLGLALLISASQGLAAQASPRPETEPKMIPSSQDPAPLQPPAKQEGIAYVSWWHGQYASDASDQSLAKVKDVGAEWISLLATWYQDTFTSTAIYSDANRTPTDFDVVHAITTAHSLGLSVMLKPHLDLANDPSHWRGDIGDGFTSEAEWDAWFASYRSFINHYAQIAQDNGVEQFCIGVELEGTVAQEARWRDIITGTLGVTGVYTGPLVYGANWTFTNTVMFWDALDFIGIDAYYPVALTTTATVTDIRIGWTDPISFLQGLSEEWNKPIIFTEIGYRSIDGAGMAPWEYSETRPLDMQEQADLYQALFDTVFPQPWLQGVFLWSWDTNPMQGGQCDRGYTPVDKPAEDVLRYFYQGKPKPGAGGLPPRPNDLGALYIYTDTLAAGWWNGSWGGTIFFTATDQVYTGTYSISATVSNWGGLSVGDGDVDTTPYQWVEFYLNKVNPGDAIMNFWWDSNGVELPKIDDCRYTISMTNGWAHVRIPLWAMQADNTLVRQFAMQPYVNGGTSSFWVDQLRLLGVIPVELSDGYTQQVSPGGTITYSHILQNYYWLTDTIGIEAVSSRNWPLTLTVGAVISPPSYLRVQLGAGTTATVQLGPGMTATVQVQLAVPLTETIGAIYTTVVTATSGAQPQYFDTLTDASLVPAPPVARFTADPMEGCAPLEVTFTDESQGEPPVTSWLWDFDDGYTSTLQNPTHTFGLSGTYDVLLTVENPSGTNSISQTIIVHPLAVASFDYDPPDGVVPLTVYFSNTSQYAENPVWNFGDGNYGAGDYVSNTYDMTGTFTVVLTVTSPYGCGDDTFSAPVSVSPPCLPVQILDITTEISGCVVTFTPSLAGDPPFAYLWVFGDGMTSTEAMPMHDYGATGTYTGTLTVTNCVTGTDTMQFVVDVSCAPPPPQKWYIYLPLIFKGYDTTP